MTKRDFDRLAAQWDQEPRRQRLSTDIAAGIRQAVPLDAAMHLLDYGCGTGLVAMHLLPLVGRLTGLDSSSGMLSVFAGKLSPADQGRVTLHTLDLAAGGRFDGIFDVIVAAMLLHHIEHPPDLLSRLSSHLAPGGYLCIADLDAEDGSFHDDPTGIFHHGFDREQVACWLSEANLATSAMLTVSTIEKPAPAGGVRRFPVFLAVGVRT